MVNQAPEGLSLANFQSIIYEEAVARKHFYAEGNGLLFILTILLHRERRKTQESADLQMRKGALCIFRTNFRHRKDPT